WDAVTVERFAPAFEIGLGLMAAEIAVIASDPNPATFDNTIVPLENSGRHFDRAETVFGVWTGNLNTPELQAVEREWSPKITAAYDQITFDEKLFSRIASVYEARASAKLTAEQTRLLERTYDRFVRAGAKLTQAQKQQLGAINQ